MEEECRYQPERLAAATEHIFPVTLAAFAIGGAFTVARAYYAASPVKHVALCFRRLMVGGFIRWGDMDAQGMRQLACGVLDCWRVGVARPFGLRVFPFRIGEVGSAEVVNDVTDPGLRAAVMLGGVEYAG